MNQSAVFADYMRNAFKSSEGSNDYFYMTGDGYILNGQDVPVQAEAGYDFLNADWNSESVGFYWPGNGPAIMWNDIYDILVARGVRFYLNETVDCFDLRAPANEDVPFILRTDKRLVYAERVVWATTAGQMTEWVKGGLGVNMSSQDEMKAMATPFGQCSIELFYEDLWWKPDRSVPTDPFCLDPLCESIGIDDTDGIRNYTEWTYYDSQNGIWFRYMPTPNIQAMKLLRVLPDFCQEWEETFQRYPLSPPFT